MVSLTQNMKTLDRMAIGLSGLCLAHCLATAVFVSFLAAAGGVLVHHAVHQIGLVIAIILGVISLGRGVVTHGFAMPCWVGSLGIGIMAGAVIVPHNGNSEIIFTVLGVSLLALGHDLNRRAVV